MKKIVQTKHAPAPIGPYNQAILSGGTLYASGQIALNPETGAFVTENIQAETHQVMHDLHNNYDPKLCFDVHSVHPHFELGQDLAYIN